jgi:hypothetical protein
MPGAKGIMETVAYQGLTVRLFVIDLAFGLPLFEQPIFLQAQSNEYLLIACDMTVFAANVFDTVAYGGAEVFAARLTFLLPS